MLIVGFQDGTIIDKEERKSLLGGKGTSLVEMSTDLALPVPPGFVITTQAFHQYIEEGSVDFLQGDLQKAIIQIENRVNKKFGEGPNPLLVSVRSGAAISMPGMMDTILNLGLNTRTTQALERQSNKHFADECRNRFRTMYSSIVLQQDEVRETDIPEDTWQQLLNAIEAVFNSWNSPRAITYRNIENISHTLGTAVTVQSMVFGNMGPQSGTGVAFTRNPSTGIKEIFGDYLPNAQGEDVVAGTHQTLKLEEMKKIVPDAYQKLSTTMENLEWFFNDMVDIEFTVENSELWILQSRVGKRTPLAAIQIAVDMVNDPKFALRKNDAIARVPSETLIKAKEGQRTTERASAIAKGIGASPGIAVGQAVFSADDAVDFDDDGKPVILIRSETSPSDVHGMAIAQGILTATGGLASHAAVVARGWGIPAVVGATEISISESIIRIGNHVIKKGDTVTIDGASGEIFLEEIDYVEVETVPALKIFTEWLEEINSI